MKDAEISFFVSFVYTIYYQLSIVKITEFYKNVGKQVKPVLAGCNFVHSFRYWCKQKPGFLEKTWFLFVWSNLQLQVFLTTEGTEKAQRTGFGSM